VSIRLSRLYRNLRSAFPYSFFGNSQEQTPDRDPDKIGPRPFRRPGAPHIPILVLAAAEGRVCFYDAPLTWPATIRRVRALVPGGATFTPYLESHGVSEKDLYR